MSEGIEPVCIDCSLLISGPYYGAGDGTGQKFRCPVCHLRSNYTALLCEVKELARAAYRLTLWTDYVNSDMADLKEALQQPRIQQILRGEE